MNELSFLWTNFRRTEKVMHNAYGGRKKRDKNWYSCRLLSAVFIFENEDICFYRERDTFFAIFPKELTDGGL